MVRTVGARELKTRLGTWLRVVQDGTTLIVTDHGRPVAEIRRLPRGDEDDLQGRLEAMASRGEVTLPSSPWTAREGIPCQGAPVSDALVEDREDRF